MHNNEIAMSFDHDFELLDGQSDKSEKLPFANDHESVIPTVSDDPEPDTISDTDVDAERPQNRRFQIWLDHIRSYSGTLTRAVEIVTQVGVMALLGYLSYLLS